MRAVPLTEGVAVLLRLSSDRTGAFAAMVARNGLSANGAGLSSGSGSIEITAMAPRSDAGNVRPLGALRRKSSPGNGGPGCGPLNRADPSAPLGLVNRPVLNA